MKAWYEHSETWLVGIFGFFIFMGIMAMALKKFMEWIKPPCSNECPDPNCQKFVREIHDDVIVLKSGQEEAIKRLDQKQITINRISANVDYIRGYLEKNKL